MKAYKFSIEWWRRGRTEEYIQLAMSKADAWICVAAYAARCDSDVSVITFISET